MVVGEASINNIMGGIENTGSVRLHNHKRKLKQRFDIIKKLGQGTYGKVQLGINKETGQEVAIKTIKKSKIETEADLIRIRREIQIMSSVQHPNIIHIYEVFENREKMVLVMEYAAGGELYDYLSERKVLVEEEARRIFRQIATACYYCHKHKICHRDLKLENILLDENRNAKIADFGLSNVFDDHRLLSTFCGSPLYASPEIVKGTPYHGPEADCWSLGVLLYTLVYGAMPFDGSNFKRLVKQISQGDYFEPKSPSPASPLIQEMLTVNAKNRANIEKICAHWWVNEGYDESCLYISEDLANQTPVRLDVLLSLNPPPPQLESDQLVVAGEANEEQMKAEPAVPTRSQSAGSLLMDVSNPAERRIKELIGDVKVPPPKRKLETTVSTEQANVSQDGKRKEKIVKERTIADISVSGHHEEPPEDVKMMEVAVKNGVEAVEPETVVNDPNLQGAACAELIEEAKKNEIRKPVKVKKTMSSSISNKILEEINENPSQESLHNHATAAAAGDREKNKENQPIPAKQPQETVKTEPAAKDEKEKDAKTPVKKKVVKKKVLSDKNETVKPSAADGDEKKEKEEVSVAAEPPSKPVERRQSRIFEQAEKFQSMIQDNKSQSTASPEKPKKIIIPGVSVGGFKKEFERKASLKNVSPPKVKTTMSKKHVIEDKVTPMEPEPPKVEPMPVAMEEVAKAPAEAPTTKTAEPAKEELKKESKEEPPAVVGTEDVERKLKMKNAVSIISNALDKEGARKSKSRPCMSRKPPVPFGASGRSASGSIAMISSPLSPPPDIKRFLKLQPTSPVMPLSSTPEQVKQAPEPAVVLPENQTSSAEITLKSATLPRRKSSKAEIQLDYPKAKAPTMEFKTEMAHQVQVPPPTLSTQRSEVMFPVNTPPINVGLRSSSLEPESRIRERIIPIAFEKVNEPREPLQSPPTKPPVPRGFQTQKSTSTQRSNSLSRQSTQESDSETTVSGDPIKKSPREYIIPIAVEGGGYVTPRAGSLEPSDTSSTVTNSSRKTTGSKFSRPRRMMSLFDRDGSEDESPFGTLHRHSSFGKDSDTEGDSRKDSFHMHRLRSSRPRKSTLEHNDSLSSGEDDDDEDGFEFLTAENLFSTLLSRVRDLTQRINTDENPRPGFPNSRLLSHFDHGNFWNRMEPLGSRNSPLGRQFSRERSASNSSSATAATPWRRSVSRDLASDIDSVFSDPRRTPTHTATLPRGGKVEEDRNKESLNLSDLNLKKLKLTEEDALALSYLTPGLSRRIQKQLFASLPASEARKISRTLSMRDDGGTEAEKRRGSSTLPRRFSFDKRSSSQQNLTGVPNSLIGEGEVTSETGYLSKPRYQSLREPTTREYRSKYSLRSPDSSISEISSITDDSFTYGPESTSLGKYVHSSSILENTKSLENPKPARKISRFLRPDFYDPPKEDNLVVKEKKEREMETQKVLKEIRDKRIKNRISMRRERSLSREKSLDGNGNEEKMVRCKDLVDALTQDKLKRLDGGVDGESRVKGIKDERVFTRGLRDDNKKNDEGEIIIARNNILKTSEDDRNQRLKTTEENPKTSDLNDTEVEQVNYNTESLLQDVSDNIRNIESNVLSNSQHNGTIKKERISKLIRPKSYPTENGAPKPAKRSPEKSPTEAKLDQKSSETRKVLEKASPESKSPDPSEANARLNEKPSTDVETTKSSEIPNNKLPKKPTDMKFARRSSEVKSPDIPTTLDSKAHRKSLDIKYIGKSLDTMTTGVKTNGKSPEMLETKNKLETKSAKLIGKSLDSSKSNTNEDPKSNGKLSKIKSFDISNEHRKSSPDIKSPGKSSEILPSTNKLIVNTTKTNGRSTKTKSPLREDSKSPEAILDTKLNEKSKTTKLKKSTSQPTDKPLSTKNKFLHSIEKKIEKLRTFNNEEKKAGGVETTIKRLREQSVPRNVDHITESTLIKRAVSVEDFSNVKPNKTLQPSRKSVTKILGLFKKYEDRTPKEENGGDPQLGNITETNIPKPADKERPKSLQVEKVVKPVSKLPVNSHRKSLNLDDNNKSVNNNNNNEPDRKSLLKLDFSNINKETQDVNLNRISYTTDESSTLLSPCDETTSCDSWSVCSDYHHTQDLSSPLSPNGNTYSGDENESVIDRIRRKSFYTRFNDKPKPKPRKSLIGNYKDLDLYKEYNQKTLPRYKISSDYKRNSGYSSSGEMDHEYRPYVRSKSVSSEYSGIPNRYQTYNPRRSNASSLYAHEDSNMEDLSTTGIYKKYSYTPNTSRLGSLSRASRSPSSDFQYIPHPHTSTSLPPPSQTAENGHTVTEHAV